MCYHNNPFLQLYREAIFKVQNARFTDAVPAKKRLNNGVTRKSLGER